MKACNLVVHYGVSGLELALFKKLCKRSLNPAGTSKILSSPAITSIFRVLS